MATPSVGPSTSRPRHLTLPAVGFSSPETIRSRVDLPEPRAAEQGDDLTFVER